MSVVRIPPTLRAESGGARQVEAAGDTVRAVLEDLGERHPALGARILENGGVAEYVNVYVDGEDMRTLDGLDTPVRESSTLILLPAMAGGTPAPLAGDGFRRAKPGSAARLVPLAALQSEGRASALSLLPAGRRAARQVRGKC